MVNSSCHLLKQIEAYSSTFVFAEMRGSPGENVISSTEQDSVTSPRLRINSDGVERPLIPKSPPPAPRALVSRSLTITADLTALIPSGVLLLFELLIPVTTKDGVSDSVTVTITLCLLFALLFSCALCSFIDTVKSADGKQVYYGFATFDGIFLFDCPDHVRSGLNDLKRYRIRFIDGVHAVVSVFAFGAIGLKDKDVLTCLFPMPQRRTQEVLDILPVVIGVVCCFLAIYFPTRRLGMSYTHTSDDDLDLEKKRAQSSTEEPQVRVEPNLGRNEMVSAGISLQPSIMDSSNGVVIHGKETDYPGETKYCRCRVGGSMVKAPRWTSWTTSNPGRRFYGCPNFTNKKKSCGYFEWHDEEFSERARDVINYLRSENEQKSTTDKAGPSDEPQQNKKKKRRMTGE